MEIFFDPELQEILRNQIKLDRGTNLAGQGGSGLSNRLRNQVQETDPYAYGSYVIPASDPTYSSGFNYARTIAGGMPFEDVVAPGMSFSPEDPMGYTQADLDLQNRFRGKGPVLVMPKAPTKGTPFAPNEGFVQMPSAPQGVTGPTRLLPSLQGLDFSGLPRYEDIRDIRGVEDITPSLFDFDVQEILKDVDTLKNIDAEALQDIDLSGIDIPPVATGMPKLPDFSNIPSVDESVATSFMPGSGMGRIGQGVATDRESLIGKTVFGQTITPESFGSGPMKKGSFLGGVARPNIPVMPELPYFPQPIQPMNFTRLSNLPVSNFVQPSVDEIVRPITRQGKFLPQAPRGLFSL